MCASRTGKAADSDAGESADAHGRLCFRFLAMSQQYKVEVSRVATLYFPASPQYLENQMPDECLLSPHTCLASATVSGIQFGICKFTLAGEAAFVQIVSVPVITQ